MIKKYIFRLALWSLGLLMLAEVVGAVVLDPVFFARVDTYRDVNRSNLHSVLTNAFGGHPTNHCDLLFVGSSRVPATIDAAVARETAGVDTVLVAGRGYSTPWLHYQALQNKLIKYPDFLKDATVLIELPGSRSYEAPFAVAQRHIDSKMPHLLAPHVNGSALYNYVAHSDDPWQTRLAALAAACCRSYRGILLLQDFFDRLDKPVFGGTESDLADEGGIRADNVDLVIQKAKEAAQRDAEISAASPPLTATSLDASMLAEFHELVSQHGGRLALYRMPLHSMQAAIYESDKELANARVFQQWCQTNGIPIVDPDVDYSDDDFPDLWHFGRSRRAEFTRELMKKLAGAKLLPPSQLGTAAAAP